MFPKVMPIGILARQTALLRSHLPGLLDGTMDSIHDARIATRRLREVLPLTHEWQRRHVVDDLSARFKRMGRSLGRVRDADVRIELLRYLGSRVPPAAPVLVTVRQRQQADRLILMRRLVKRLERLEIERELARLDSGAEWPHSRFWIGLTGTWRRELRQLMAERAHAAAAAVARATGVYFPNRVHDARIAIKKCRYAAEIAAETGIFVDGSLLRDLKKAQDVLGDLHDRQTLIDELSAVLSRPGTTTAPGDVQLAIQVLQAEADDCHRNFLGRRGRVLAACERAHRGAQPQQPSGAKLLAAGVAALTGLEAVRRQRRGRPARAAAARVPSDASGNETSVRIPVPMPERRLQSR